MSNNSFKNLQNKLQQLKKELEPDEPKRRKEGLRYLNQLLLLIRESYVAESTSDYMFTKTLIDAVSESKYFGGFTNRAKERLRIIEKRYNYIHEEKRADIE